MPASASAAWKPARRAAVVARPTGSSGSPLIITMSRWPSSTRCRTAITAPARSSTPTREKPGSGPPTAASGTCSERSASCSAGSSEEATASTASTRRRSGIVAKNRARPPASPTL